MRKLIAIASEYRGKTIKAMIRELGQDTILVDSLVKAGVYDLNKELSRIAWHFLMTGKDYYLDGEKHVN
jgi:hypothetical protein